MMPVCVELPIIVYDFPEPEMKYTISLNSLTICQFYASNKAVQFQKFHIGSSFVIFGLKEPCLSVGAFKRVFKTIQKICSINFTTIPKSTTFIKLNVQKYLVHNFDKTFFLTTSFLRLFLFSCIYIFAHFHRKFTQLSDKVSMYKQPKLTVR